MKLLFDFFPILLFFVFFKFYGIYTATLIMMAASLIQVAVYWLKNRRIDPMQGITLLFVLFLGGATLLFHNPMFIKWKPTVVYWVFAAALLSASLWGKTTLLQKLMGKNVILPVSIWSRLNLGWIVFFTLMGAVNIYVAYHFDTDTWVNFKLFGGFGLTLLFAFGQAAYLFRHARFTFGETQ